MAEKPTIKLTVDDSQDELQDAESSPTVPERIPGRPSTTESVYPTSYLLTQAEFTLKVKMQMSRLHLISTLAGSLAENQNVLGKSGRLDLVGQITSVYEQFVETHQILEKAWPIDLLHHPYIIEDVYDQVCRKVAEISILSAKMAAKEPSQSTVTAPDIQQATQSLARLPKLSVPKFHGTSASWISFKDQFKAMIIDQPSLDEVSKFTYLKSALSGPALALVASLPHTAESFSKAWDTLTSRYENKKKLIHVHLEKLFSQFAESKRAGSTAEKISSLLTVVDNSLDSLTMLGQSINNWDTILIFHVLKHLDQRSKELWETQDNDSDRMPTYTEFREFLLSRIRTLEKLEPSSRATTQKSSHFTTGSRQFICDCCNGSHFMVSCPEYTSLPLEQRLRIVQQKKLCRNCMGRHNTPACTNKHRCKECGEKHHTMFHSLLSRQSSSDNQASTSKQ